MIDRWLWTLLWGRWLNAGDVVARVIDWRTARVIRKDGQPICMTPCVPWLGLN